ncbi:hypothetical protein [Maritimibacter alkaliphilus]|nr:hypothetical protein [Maritimibacter alkaliphilus]
MIHTASQAFAILTCKGAEAAGVRGVRAHPSGEMGWAQPRQARS